MRIPPDFFDSTHTLVSSTEPGVNVVIISKVVGNAGAEVFKSEAKDNVSISNINSFCFRDGIVHGILSCCAGVFRFLRFVGRGTEGCVSDISRIVRACVMIGKLGIITCGGGEMFACVVDIIEELRRGEEYTFSF